VGVLLLIMAALVVLLLSNRFGRAVPTQDYRPELPPAALATRCFPLPGDVQLDFSHQVRRDGDVETAEGPRRHLVGQYDEIDEADALASIVEAFREAGFTEDADPGDHDAVLHKPGEGVVRVQVEQLPDIEEDTLVRGSFELDLPVAHVRPDAPEVCDDPKSTKRWDD
jgi:hypothetical protein